MTGAEFVSHGKNSSKGGAHGGTVSKRAIDRVKAAVKKFINSSDTEAVETEDGTLYYHDPTTQSKPRSVRKSHY